MSEPQVSDSAGALFERTVGLLRYIASVGFGVPSEEAEAVVQDTYLAYLVNGSSARDAKAWLVGAIRNGCRQYWRKAGREVPLPQVSSEWEDPRHAMHQTHLIDWLTAEKVIARLPAADRDLLERFYIHEESTSAIAAALGATPGAVQVRLHSSRKRAQVLYRELTRVQS